MKTTTTQEAIGKMKTSWLLGQISRKDAMSTLVSFGWSKSEAGKWLTRVREIEQERAAS